VAWLLPRLPPATGWHAEAHQTKDHLGQGFRNEQVGGGGGLAPFHPAPQLPTGCRNEGDTNDGILKAFLTGFGERPIATVTAEELKRYVNSLPKRTWKTKKGKIKNEGASESFVKKTITHIRGLFDLAVEKDFIAKHPSRSLTIKLKVPKQTRKPDKSVFPPQDFLKLLAVMNEQDQLVVWLAAFSLRPNEIFAIRGAAVGPDFIHIENAMSNEWELKGTKTDKGKFVALGEDLARKTHRWMAAKGIQPQDFLFKTRIGTVMTDENFLKKHLRPAAKRAKIATIDVDHQMLRRSFATLANALGFDVKNIQAQMGHARPDMSLIEYAQPVDEVRRRQIQHMEDVLLGKAPMPVDLTAKLGSRLVN
jgi:site-specific recombinase XerD